MSTSLSTEVAQPSTPMRLLEMAVAKDASIEQMKQLLELQERWEANEARKAFFAAMAKFKENAPRIVKNVTKKAGQMDLHYASLDNVVGTITPALSAVGIRHRWEMKQEGSLVTVTCVLSHDMGHSEATALTGPNDTSGSKNVIQAIGSVTTYLQRYTLLAATGLAASGMDTDGADAIKNPRMPEQEFVNFRDSIEGARDIAELQRLFSVAYVAAQRVRDQASQADFIAAKNKRKGELA